MQEKHMHLVNQLFNSSMIRTIWDSDEEKYYISVVDVISSLTGSQRPRKYWSDLKIKLKEEGSELSEKIGQLKLKSSDGKYYKTDVTDIAGMFRIIESIPSKNAEPLKLWLAHLGKERIDEIFDPSIATQRSIDLYRAKGYDEAWIAKRIKGIQDRKELTDVWKEGGITEEKDYAIITDEIYKVWAGMNTKKYREYKGLTKESLRDNMDSLELILTDLSEEATKRITQNKKPRGLEENIKIAKKGGRIAKNARLDLEKEIGESIVTPNNALKRNNNPKKKMIKNK